MGNAATVQAPREHSTRGKGKVRHSVMLKEPVNTLPKQDIPTVVPEESAATKASEVLKNVFQIKVPPGVPPGGSFSAICKDHYVRVEVPEDAVPGDIIEIDLSEVFDDMPDEKDVPPTDTLRKAATLFMKYDQDKNFYITGEQLQYILDNEMGIPQDAGHIKQDAMLKNVASVSFDEFRHWFEHITMKIEIHMLEHRRLDMSTIQENVGVEETRLADLRAEQERLREACEHQKEEFRKEIESLKKEKERLTSLEDGNSKEEFSARNDAKLRIMEKHHKENEE